MARLYLVAEGVTEQQFAARVLTPHLSGFGVYLHPPVLIAHARRKGRIHRGGGRNYLPMKNDIQRFLKQDNHPDVFVTTMIDLYAIHTDFPGLNDAEKFRHLPTTRVEQLEASFKEDIGHHRFVPFIQLHEFETVLFCAPHVFADIYDRSDRQIAELQAIADAFESPELINDGPHTAPSKRIIAHFPDYKAAKSVVGPLVAEAIGLETIRSKCPHFNDWLTKLECLGSPLTVVQ